MLFPTENAVVRIESMDNLVALLGFAVRQDKLRQALRRLAFDIWEGRHPHASLLNLLNNGVLVCHLIAYCHYGAGGFGFVAFCTACIKYIFPAGIFLRRVIVRLRTAHQTYQRRSC